jgi:phenylalanyl-tRNA synthetase beta chain
VKIPFSWLRDFVDVPGSPEEVAQTMSVRGFAVEGIETVAGEAVIDFEVTANRPDCLSIVGIAREVATAYELPLLNPAGPASLAPALRTTDSQTSGSRRAGASEAGPANSHRGARAAEGGPAALDVVIENPDLCPRYVGAVADVTVTPSPAWMQTRLQAAGVRPINNIVDVTNYVLLETGQPMHAFDYHALAAASNIRRPGSTEDGSGAQIRVRTAKPGESIRTLDGQSRSLSPDVLVIADAERPAAVAGVMGGGDSEVTSATKTIVLESAYFDPRSVRRTSRKLGLRTEASTRFERGADSSLPLAAMTLALALLEAIEAGRGRGAIVDCHPKRRDPLRLRLRRAKIAGLLGAALPDVDVQRILSALGFVLQDVSDGWDVTVPTRRVDVLREVDLIEELARHYGFDRLPISFPALTTAPRPLDPRVLQNRHLRRILTAEGFHEAVTFGFIARAAAARFAAEAEVVAIANPLSENFAVLRPSALPGLIDAVAHNRHREQRDVRLFEIGARFSSGSGERRAVACIWTGTAASEHWAGGARDVDFFDIKGVVERVCEAAGAAVDATVACREPWLAPGRAAEVRAQGVRIAVLGQLAADVVAAHGLPAEPVYVAEIDLTAIEGLGVAPQLRVEPLPRFPSVTRDISVLVDDTLAAADVRETIRQAGPSTLVRVAEFDRYQGKGVPDLKVSLSLRLTFRSPERTLTDGEVQTAMEQVLSALKTQHGAVQR